MSFGQYLLLAMFFGAGSQLGAWALSQLMGVLFYLRAKANQENAIRISGQLVCSKCFQIIPEHVGPPHGHS
jgi:hypothetical protein